MFSGENYVPDFNLVDYGISVYPLDFLDRHMAFPGLVDNLDHLYELREKDRNYPEGILEGKTIFANMIASHDSDNGVRADLFDLLSQYKRVEAPGALRYNMPDGEKVKREDGSKRNLQKKCKFTLCCESTCEEGFVTEKLFEAFSTDTIPVYLGSNTVCDYFNKDAFINIADYESLQDVVDRIIELDQNDEKYLQMLRQPVFTKPSFIREKLDELERFLCNIFDQPLKQAFRRPQSYYPKAYESIVSIGSKSCEQKKWNQNRKNERKEFWRYLPNRVALKMLGNKGYERIKNIKR